MDLTGHTVGGIKFKLTGDLPKCRYSVPRQTHALYSSLPLTTRLPPTPFPSVQAFKSSAFTFKIQSADIRGEIAGYTCESHTQTDNDRQRRTIGSQRVFVVSLW